MVVDMKAKFLIVVLAALVLATGTVWAQKGHHNRRAEHKELTTEQVAKKMTDRMKENLSLSDEQVKQVYPICLEQAQAMREHRAERREMAEKSREAMAQQREQMGRPDEGGSDARTVCPMDRMPRVSRPKGRLRRTGMSKRRCESRTSPQTLQRCSVCG